MENRRITQFTDKYTKTGHIGNLLVNNFFKKIKEIAPKDTENLLEVGCGAGYSLVELKKFFNSDMSFSACDIDPKLVELAKQKNPDVDCRTASIYELPYDDESFDTVICLEVMEHLENPEKALSELARITKKHIIISTPNEPIWRILNCVRGKYIKDFGNTPGHINHWSSGSLKKMISKYFKIMEVKKPLPWTIVYGKNKNLH